jgi:hypothetical protein
MTWRAAALGLGLLAFPAATNPPALATVPFTYLHHEVVVRARIAGAGPFAFLLDTGTTPSIIDAVLAKRLGLSARGAAGRGTDIGSTSTTAYPVTIRDLQVGALHVSRLDARSLNIAATSKRIGVPLAGVLGSNIFDGRVVQIDYPCRKISVLADALLAPFTARFNEIADGWIVTNDFWVGSQRASAAIDTGDSGVAIVTGPGIEALHLQTAARAGKTVSSFSYGGRHSETLGVLHDVRLGSRPLGTLTARFLPEADNSFDVNIGNRLLQHFVVTFDYARGLLTISPARACSGS